MGDTRERIVAAAKRIVVAGSGAKPSVRTVAAEAGVGASTLRYYFPTQRALLDAVLESVYAEALPDERIHDPALPPQDRLVECLQNLLAPVGTGQQAREFWRQVFSAFVDSEASAGYPSMVRQARRRVESWLAALEEEGAVPQQSDRAHSARFLLAIVDGIAIERAMPGEDSGGDEENAILRTAVASVMRSGGAA